MLVHGLQVQGHTWDPIAEDLARYAHIVCPDLRGHGLSGWPEEGYLLDSFVDDLGEIAGDAELAGLRSRWSLARSADRHRVRRRAPRGRQGRLVLSDTGPELPPKANTFTKRSLGPSAVTSAVFPMPSRRTPTTASAIPSGRRASSTCTSSINSGAIGGSCLPLGSRPRSGCSDPPEAATMRAFGMCQKRTTRTPSCGVSAATSSPRDRATNDGPAPDGRLVRTDTGHYIPRERPDLFIDHVRRFVGLSADAGASADV